VSDERTDLHLGIRVTEEKRTEFMAFLRQARELYERPGGIRVRLLRHKSDPQRYIEIMEYTGDAFEADQVRVEQDPEMIAALKTWRTLLAEKPQVDIWEDITSQLD